MRVLFRVVFLSLLFFGCQQSQSPNDRGNFTGQEESISESELDLTRKEGKGTKSDPIVIVGVYGPRDHGEVLTGVVVQVDKCLKEHKFCEVIVPSDQPTYPPEDLCARIYERGSPEWVQCVERFKKCRRPGGRCKTSTYDPKTPTSLPDVIGKRTKVNIICHHVPTSIGNPIWDCPCDPKELGKKNPNWYCCFSQSCSETSGGGTPSTPNPEGVLTVDELKNLPIRPNQPKK